MSEQYLKKSGESEQYFKYGQHPMTCMYISDVQHLQKHSEDSLWYDPLA